MGFLGRLGTCAAALAVAIALGGCDGDIGSGETGGSSAAGPGAGAGGSGAGSTGPAAGGGTSTASSSSGGAPPCQASTLAEAVRITDVAAEATGGGNVVYAASADGGFVAFAGNDGNVHVVPLDALDQRAGEDWVVEATQPYGLAATPAGVFLLASRAPDYMTFMRLDGSGNVAASEDLIGGGNHETEGVEWFGEFAQTARLVATGDSGFAAYSALHRRWPDGIGHQGDTLRAFDASGAPAGGGWGWGCSHSLDQRIAVSGTTLGPICVADCYPGKGIYFSNSVQLIDDPSANCAGGVGTLLGGIAAVADGFWVSFGKNGEMQLVKLGLDGTTLLSVPLDAGTSQHRIALYDGALLSASVTGAGTTLRRADVGGAWMGEAETVPDLALPTGDDMTSLPSGEVGWATAGAGGIRVVRVRKCR